MPSRVFRVPPRGLRLLVAVAASYGLAERSPLLRAYKWGVLGRLLAVFRVSDLVVYVDEPAAASEAERARRLLEYMVVAPYLRRAVFPMLPELRYAGVLPPLQLPTHGVGGVKAGECREALLLGGDVVDAGLGEPVRVPGVSRAPRPPGPGRRVVVCVESLEPLRLRPARPGEVYMGYRVLLRRSLRGALGLGVPVLATSRLGRVAGQRELASVAEAARRRGGLLVAFGSPSSGLAEIASREGFRLEDAVDWVYNTVPGQGTLTVRVEEALAATLAQLNPLLG
ncbi:MAG: hypothetical protein GXO15_03900 [Crenarchaeota archaeon]|nr:hypothetical protein [Thermoproteota archaeon]